jgi:hypothetical protein
MGDLPVCKVDHIVYKMWEPRRLTTLWAPTACYRNSFLFYIIFQFEFTDYFILQAHATENLCKKYNEVFI